MELIIRPSLLWAGTTDSYLGSTHFFHGILKFGMVSDLSCVSGSFNCKNQTQKLEIHGVLLKGFLLLDPPAACLLGVAQLQVAQMLHWPPVDPASPPLEKEPSSVPKPWLHNVQ